MYIRHVFMCRTRFTPHSPALSTSYPFIVPGHHAAGRDSCSGHQLPAGRRSRRTTPNNTPCAASPHSRPWCWHQQGRGKCKAPPKGSALEQAVGDKAAKVKGKDPAVWREDEYGNQLHRDMCVHSRHWLGNPHAWHADHIQTCKCGGSNYLYNLQILQCSLNMSWGAKVCQ